MLRGRRPHYSAPRKRAPAIARLAASERSAKCCWTSVTVPAGLPPCKYDSACNRTAFVTRGRRRRRLPHRLQCRLGIVELPQPGFGHRAQIRHIIGQLRQPLRGRLQMSERVSELTLIVFRGAQVSAEPERRSCRCDALRHNAARPRAWWRSASCDSGRRRLPATRPPRRSGHNRSGQRRTRGHAPARLDHRPRIILPQHFSVIVCQRSHQLEMEIIHH